MRTDYLGLCETTFSSAPQNANELEPFFDELYENGRNILDDSEYFDDPTKPTQETDAMTKFRDSSGNVTDNMAKATCSVDTTKTCACGTGHPVVCKITMHEPLIVLNMRAIKRFKHESVYDRNSDVNHEREHINGGQKQLDLLTQNFRQASCCSPPSSAADAERELNGIIKQVDFLQGMHGLGGKAIPGLIPPAGAPGNPIPDSEIIHEWSP